MSCCTNTPQSMNPPPSGRPLRPTPLQRSCPQIRRAASAKRRASTAGPPRRRRPSGFPCRAPITYEGWSGDDDQDDDGDDQDDDDCDDQDDGDDEMLNRVPPPPSDGSGRPVVDALRFRDGMSRVAASVHVVTTAGPAGRAGFTATAVAPVTDSPASLLVCIDAAGRSAQA